MKSTNATTWGQVLQGRRAYHSDVEYFMVDYFDQDNLAHIRLPFLRQEQVFQVFNLLHQSIACGATILDIRVMPESFLDEPYVNLSIVEDAISAGVNNAKFLGSSTREVLFDWRYERIANNFKSRALAIFD